MEPDAQLWEAWRSGDQTAGNELVRRHFPAIYRFLFSKIGDYAEEIAQRVFLACLEKADTVDPARGLKGLLFGYARIELLRHFEGRSRRGMTSDAISQMPLADLGDSPSGIVAGGEDQVLLVTALSRLPLEQQLALELYYWEELPIRDVATALGVAPGTIKSRLGRARERLREILSELAPDREFQLDEWDTGS